jgi:hypothetical protein
MMNSPAPHRFYLGVYAVAASSVSGTGSLFGISVAGGGDFSSTTVFASLFAALCDEGHLDLMSTLLAIVLETGLLASVQKVFELSAADVKDHDHTGDDRERRDDMGRAVLEPCEERTEHRRGSRLGSRRKRALHFVSVASIPSSVLLGTHAPTV